MPRAANWYPPDLTQSNTVLADATTQFSWTDADAAEAEHWYDHFLQAAWNADGDGGKSIKVINRKADDLWHVHKDTQAYTDYCDNCFGKKVNHRAVDHPHKPSATELAAVQTYYGSNWPIPDSIVSCST
jgi:hypothetical protein